MEHAVEKSLAPHPIFAEATSIEHFVELLRGYHAELMATRPLELRYEFQDCQVRFDFHAADDPNYCSDVAWGEYHFKLTFRLPQREGEAFATIRKDFPFLEILSSRGTGGSNAQNAEEVHGTSVDLDCFPQLHAQFNALQDLNAKHEEHVRDLDSQTQEACTNDADLQKIQYKLASHRVAIYRLEREEQESKERIAASVKANNPDPHAAERTALLPKFPTR